MLLSEPRAHLTDVNWVPGKRNTISEVIIFYFLYLKVGLGPPVSHADAENRFLLN